MILSLRDYQFDSVKIKNDNVKLFFDSVKLFFDSVKFIFDTVKYQLCLAVNLFISRVIPPPSG